ncbi:hypothetical protein [Paenibacillus elgii]|uniref:hypothetical protein n=1 Tax=Paenibacillus elgii TaxID=189691 RepID=UPI00203E9880|nr:hypothetical protein [Paenibacillus elgii]MCM3273054.1 hypothetical protein [Paenibacillus elgii]
MTHTIKVNYTDGNENITRVNGTKDEISNHYAKNNVFAWHNNEPQAKQIEYLESPYLNNRSSLVYLFMELDNSGLLQ